jgi:TM2 domain-containing membrane protein YozV
MKNPGTAAVLSLIVPGIGQIYNRAIWRGIFWLIITPGFWIGTGGTLGWICHFISAYTAYNYAKKLNL